MPQSKGTIFINYRRDDSNWNALALYNELQKYFSRDQIFKDFNAISPGDDFVVSINNALQSCDVLLVLIGSKWLGLTDASGQRRLDEEEDFVRLEIAKALSRNIKVIPVLLDGVKMPLPEQLPESLQSLPRRQSVSIDPAGFEDDVRNLAEAIKKILPQPSAGEKKPVNVDPFSGSPVVTAPKPDNNMVWGILTTIICCLPLGIMSIVSASKVDTLYRDGKPDEAQAAAAQAKKYAIWAIGVGVTLWVIYFILYAMGLVPEGNYNG